MFGALLQKLGVAATGPFAFVAYVILIAGWVYSVYWVGRLKAIMGAVAKLSPDAQAECFKHLTRKDLSLIPRDKRYQVIRGEKLLIGYLATLIAILILAALFVHAVLTPMRAVSGRLDEIKKNTETTTQSIEDVKSDVEENTRTLEGLCDDLLTLVECIAVQHRPGHAWPNTSDDPKIASIAARILAALRAESQTPPGDDIELRLAEGVLAIVRGDFDKTPELLPPETAERPTRVTVARYRTLGLAFYGRQKPKDALACYNRVIELRPDDSNAKTLAANCEQMIARGSEASVSEGQNEEQATTRDTEWRPASRPKPAAIVRPAYASTKELMAFLCGSFSNEQQHASHPDEYPDIRLNIIPIWTTRRDGPWLYVEHSLGESPDQPYRQRVYRLVPGASGRIERKAYRLPGDPLRFAGAWRTQREFDTLRPGDLHQCVDCVCRLERNDYGIYFGVTEGRGCESTTPGAVYATSYVAVTDTQIITQDISFDANGEQVGGGAGRGYEFYRADGAAEVDTHSSKSANSLGGGSLVTQSRTIGQDLLLTISILKRSDGSGFCRLVISGDHGKWKRAFQTPDWSPRSRLEKPLSP